MAKNDTKTEKTTLKREANSALPLGRLNFILMTAAGVLIVVGFALMVGGGTGDDTFSENIFSSMRIVVAPLLAFLGFVLMGVGIIIKPRTKKNESAEKPVTA